VPVVWLQEIFLPAFWRQATLRKSSGIYDNMKASVIVPTFNRLERLKQVLAGLEQQDFPLADFEVVVVSDGSTDGTEEFLRSYQTPLQLKPIFQKNQGVAAARNAGLAQAKEDILIFVDDDVVPMPCLVGEHIHSQLGANGRRIVLGPMLTPPDFNMLPWVKWEQAMLMKQYKAMENRLWEPTARQFYTGNTSVPRKEVLDAGGFDPAFSRAEDVELAYRLASRGLTFLYNPQAVGYHYAQRSFDSWLKTPYLYGKNDVIFHQQKGQTWLLPTIAREFKTRNPLIRALVHLCLDRAILTRLVIQILKQISSASNYLGFVSLSNMTFSGIFNLRYYQGAADELGGRTQLLNGVMVDQ
jgi:glycosyltransferase involved in cell wall biosynthesis